MTKRITILVMLLLVPVFAFAQQGGTYRDRSGNTVGTWQDNGGQRTYRDSYGNTTGTSTRDDDRRDYRDRDGNYTGSRERRDR